MERHFNATPSCKLSYSFFFVSLLLSMTLILCAQKWSTLRAQFAEKIGVVTFLVTPLVTGLVMDVDKLEM